MYRPHSRTVARLPRALSYLRMGAFSVCTKANLDVGGNRQLNLHGFRRLKSKVCDKWLWTSSTSLNCAWLTKPARQWFLFMGDIGFLDRCSRICQGKRSPSRPWGRKVVCPCYGQKGLPKGCFPGPDSWPKANVLRVGDPFQLRTKKAVSRWETYCHPLR